MAIRERKGRAKPWQCYWNNPFTGKRECANFATRLEAEKQDSLIKHRLRFDRESFRKEDVEKDEIQELTLEQAYLLYLKEKKFNKSSLASHFSAMRSVLSFMGKELVSGIDKKRLSDLMRKLLENGVTMVTMRSKMSILRAVLRWCVEHDFRDPVDFPRLPQPRYKQFVPPTPGELRLIMSVAPEHVQRAIILGAQCGARIGSCELFALRWEHVDFGNGLIRIYGSGKNPDAHWREVPLKGALIPLMAQWANEDKRNGVEWIIHYRNKPVKSIKTAWANALRNAGITRRIRPYDLRHAFGTELVAAGVDIGTVAKLMGHSSPMMLLTHYQYVMDKQKRAAIESLPELNHVPKTCAQTKKGNGDLP